MGSRVQRHLRVSAPVDRVWSGLADLTGLVGWSADISHAVVISDAPSGVGAVRRVQVGRIAVLETVTVWEPGHALAYTVTGLPPAAGVVTTSWQVVAQGSGTDVTVTSEIEPLPGPAGRIVARVLSRRLGRTDDELVHGLARWALGRTDDEPSESSNLAGVVR